MATTILIINKRAVVVYVTITTDGQIEPLKFISGIMVMVFMVSPSSIEQLLIHL